MPLRNTDFSGPLSACCGPVALGAEVDAKAFEALAAAGPDAVAVLPDPGGEHQHVQQETLGDRGRKANPLDRIRRQVLVAHEPLSERGWARIRTGLDLGDRAGEVGAAYLAKELLREVYATRSPRQARRRLERFYAQCRAADVVELRRLAATVRRWEPDILGWYRTGLSNGPSQAMNLLVTKIKRVGHSFRNVENYSLRLLLHCGVEWGTLHPSHESEAANHAWPTNRARQRTRAPARPFPVDRSRGSVHRALHLLSAGRARSRPGAVIWLDAMASLYFGLASTEDPDTVFGYHSPSTSCRLLCQRPATMDGRG